MRLVAQFVLGVLLIGGSGQWSAAESGSRWWPFGSSDEAAASSTGSPTPLPQDATAQHQAIASQTIALDAPAVQQTTTVYPQLAPQPPAADPPKSVAADRGWSPSWPAIHFPELSSLRPPSLPRKNWGNEPQADAARNRWYGQTPEPPRRSPWQAVKGGAQRVRQGTRDAWGKTVDVFTPGDGESERLARREAPKPPLWKRMFGMEEEQPQGPRTVTEWMAQERLDP